MSVLMFYLIGYYDSGEAMVIQSFLAIDLYEKMKKRLSWVKTESQYYLIFDA